MSTFRYPHPEDYTPLILLVPGEPLTSGHWMHRWAKWSEHCRVVELGLWDEPHRNTWVNKLNLAIRHANRPVVVVTDDIAALALAWWVQFEGDSAQNDVLGAVIVSAPNVDLPGSDARLARFGACPRQALPFSAFLVSDVRDSAVSQRAIARLSKDWGAFLVSDDTRGSWPQGWTLVQTILGGEGQATLTPAWSQDENVILRNALREWAAI